MVSTEKKKQQNKKLLSQSGESEADLMIGKINHKAKAGSRENTTSWGNILNNTNDTNQFTYPKVDMHTLEKNIVSKVRIEADSVMTTVQARVHYAVLTAMESLVIQR